MKILFAMFFCSLRGHAVNKLVNDYYVGRYGGPARAHPLEVDPYRNTFTGLVDDTVEAWA